MTTVGQPLRQTMMNTATAAAQRGFECLAPPLMPLSRQSIPHRACASDLHPTVAPFKCQRTTIIAPISKSYTTACGYRHVHLSSSLGPCTPLCSEQENLAHSSLLMLPYKIGMAAGAVSVPLSVLMVFDENTVRLRNRERREGQRRWYSCDSVVVQRREQGGSVTTCGGWERQTQGVPRFVQAQSFCCWVQFRFNTDSVVYPSTLLLCRSGAVVQQTIRHDGYPAG